MRFPQSFLDELTARSDLVDIASRYTHLASKSGKYWGRCPFHSEKTPSFNISPERQQYYCFGCKKGGGVIKFIMDVENLPYYDAVYFLADRVGMTVPEGNYTEEDGYKRKRLLELNREAAHFYRYILKQEEGKAVRTYLSARQIHWQTATKFGMGAAPDSRNALLIAMTQKEYTKEELLALGLIVQKEDGRLYDKFRNRLILPVIDTRGNVVAFGSRVLDNSKPKYMNSPETSLYSKRKVLYGLNFAKTSKRPNIILCEGNLDVVTLYQAGFDNAVASMGTALTPEQVNNLGNLKKELVICYDNDEAGKKATEHALQLLNSSSLSVRVLQLPQRLSESGEYMKQDPDDFIKFEGADAFEHLLLKCPKSIEFRMEEVEKKHDLQTDEGRTAYSIEVSAIIAQLSRATEREIYASRAAEKANISPGTMKSEVERIFKGRTTQTSRQIEFPTYTTQHHEKNRSAYAEEGLIRLFLIDDTIFDNSFPLTLEQFSTPLFGKVFFILRDERDKGRRISLDLLTDKITPEEMSQITAACQRPESLNNIQKALTDYIRVIQEESSKREEEKEEIDPLHAAVEKNKRRKMAEKQKMESIKS